ncbi:AMP-binding protein [Streptomyces sp. NBC_00669]|uniref:AMP-binding protein n=1 Tax=unclassified Streptomyces TaxID=2593676 RepID=UPI002E2F1609|nr:AMP-binding protein [Streptomyces sp. NBC_00669]
MLLHEFMLSAARSTPDRPAVMEFDGPDGAVTTSFRRLESLVREYANSLADLSIGVGDRVVLESDTSAAAIAAFLACSTVGAAFIPVSPQTPPARLAAIIDTARPALHLRAAPAPREGLPADLGTARFGPGGLVVERMPARRPRRRQVAVETDTAYMIFTSGTTGRPKGVVMSHRGVTSFYRGMLAERLITADDRVATTSPLQFDFSLLDIGLALGTGATLVPVPRAVLHFPRRFLGLLREAEVTHVDGVPSIWRPVLTHEPEELAALEHLASILFCGEMFPLPELRALQRLRPTIRIINCYGATESMASSFADVPNPLPEDTRELSIGFAHPGAEMLVLDESGQPVDGPGVLGEIHLYSPALFTGYWDDPQATRAALVPDPLEPASGRLVLRTGDLGYLGPGGEVHFCGRKDSQVQIRGNRVELDEVERRILEFPGITAATVLAHPLDGGELALHAFVVAASDAAPFGETEVAVFCKQALPAYMAPARIRIVDRLPITANGKVDKAALAERYAAAPVR